MVKKITTYLVNGFLPIFFTIFSILFLITSIIIIISISNITSGIHITFGELLKMFMLSLPKVIFITLSISFFISTVSLFSKHSETQEFISLFASGMSPNKILKPFIYLSLILSLVNLFILFISIPYSKVAFKNFKIQKQQEAKFNFQTSRVSQRFGEWNIFASSQTNKKYKDLILYNDKTNRLILANKANLYTKKGYLKFNLEKGNVYSFDKNTIINFKSMTINQYIPQKTLSIFKFNEYLNKFYKLFVFYIPFALLPISLIYFIPLISIFHPRIHKNRSLLYALLIIIFYLLATKLTNSLINTLLLSFAFFISGFLLYKRKLKF